VDVNNLTLPSEAAATTFAQHEGNTGWAPIHTLPIHRESNVTKPLTNYKIKSFILHSPVASQAAYNLFLCYSRIRSRSSVFSQWQCLANTSEKH